MLCLDIGFYQKKQPDKCSIFVPICQFDFYQILIIYPHNFRMGVREQVIQGFNEFMADDSQSAGFKSMKGYEELAELIRTDAKFTDAFIDGSKKIDSQVFGTLPTKEGITAYVYELDAMAEKNGRSYSALVDEYTSNPEETLKALKGRKTEALEGYFEYRHRQNIAQDQKILPRDPSGENISNGGLSSLDHGLKSIPDFSLNDAFAMSAQTADSDAPNLDVAQNDDTYEIAAISRQNAATLG